MIKNPSTNGGDTGSIPGLGRLEGGMTTHSSILVGILEIAGNFLLEIPWTEEPGGLLSRRL